MNHISLTIPIFDSRVHLLWPYNRSETEEWMTKNKVMDVELDSQKSTAGFTFHDKSQGAIIVLGEWKADSKTQSILSHEICHATAYILHAAGVEEDRETPECFCHLQDYITKQLLQKLKVYKPKAAGVSKKPRTKKAKAVLELTPLSDLTLEGTTLPCSES